MTASRHAWWILALPLIASCAQKASDRALVNDLRVLAIRAEPPELPPGATVKLEALLADPKGGGRVLTTAWGLCTPDLVKGVSSCTEAGRTVPVGLGTALRLTVDSHALDAVPSERRDRGIDLFLVVATHGDANGAQAAEDSVAFKRLRVSTSPTPNSNPRPIRFAVASTFSGPVALAPGDVAQLEVAVTPGSFENYVDSTGLAKKEDLKFTWLMTAGNLDDAVTYQDPDGGARNRFIADAGAPPATLWVVVRDPRGGVAWVRRDVVAAP